MRTPISEIFADMDHADGISRCVMDRPSFAACSCCGDDGHYETEMIEQDDRRICPTCAKTKGIS